MNYNHVYFLHVPLLAYTFHSYMHTSGGGWTDKMFQVHELYEEDYEKFFIIIYKCIYMYMYMYPSIYTCICMCNTSTAKRLPATAGLP